MTTMDAADTAAAIVRERAAQAREALDDCAANAPWDADYCKRAVAENEALADLLEALGNVRGKHFVEVEHVQAFENALRALEAAITAGAEHWTT